jgi:hypothetical protein
MDLFEEEESEVTGQQPLAARMRPAIWKRLSGRTRLSVPESFFDGRLKRIV